MASPASLGEESREEAEEGRDEASPSPLALPGLEPCEVNLGMVCTLRDDFGLPEGKDSLFRWPSDDKRKSEGPGSEKQVDQLERIAKKSKDIMESQGISLYFFNFNKFQQLPRGAFRDFPFNQLQNAEKMTALRPASARGRLL